MNTEALSQTQDEKNTQQPGKLVNSQKLLETLFDDDCRPTTRWLRKQQQRKAIPFVKIGGLIFFNVEQVREALAKKNTVRKTA